MTTDELLYKDGTELMVLKVFTVSDPGETVVVLSKGTKIEVYESPTYPDCYEILGYDSPPQGYMRDFIENPKRFSRAKIKKWKDKMEER